MIDIERDKVLDVKPLVHLFSTSMPIVLPINGEAGKDEYERHSETKIEEAIPKIKK